MRFWEIVMGLGLGLVGSMPNAHAEVEVETHGAVVEIPAPASTVSRELESDTEAPVFVEVTRTLDLDLVVDTAQPGTYGGTMDYPFMDDIVPSGTVVTSYYVHADRVGSGDVEVIYDGSPHLHR